MILCVTSFPSRRNRNLSQTPPTVVVRYPYKSRLFFKEDSRAVAWGFMLKLLTNEKVTLNWNSFLLVSFGHKVP